MVINYLDSSLRVETLSFEEAADFNPQGDSIFLMIFRWGSRIKPPTANRPQMSTGHCQIFNAVLKWI